MNRTQLSIPVGLLVENVLTSGEPKEVIIDCLQRRDYSRLLPLVKESAMDFDERLQTAADIGDDWEKAIRQGYEFKFLHINGLKRLLDFRFDREVDRDYVQDELSLKHICLTAEEIELLQSLIGRQWLVQVEEVEAAEEGRTESESSSHIPVRIQLKFS
ncbi:hypothetical protein BS614_17780 [Paenibacillus xylanexedens]|uniref:hypothetical protein n=1 Tax=Paenibacillus xylanexedens TaxID=528191 RepID=UPI0009387755|nr:hypothetical protein [Paenibacillus xylanexedens]APO45683.1 hypothetical protein BS614_17780 [Paenibacillus xylanexedens]